MRAELANLNDCAVPFLSRAAVNLCWYYYIYTWHGIIFPGSRITKGEVCSAGQIPFRGIHIPSVVH